MTALLAPAPSPLRASVAEFRAFQAERPTEKWQLIAGRLYLMAGGSIRHARIIGNLAFALRLRLQGGPCEAFASEANVVHEAGDFSAYPDVMVRCGAPLDRELEVTDPTACFEVLSPSTKHLDRGAKLFAYQQIASLQCIALLASEERRIELWERGADGLFIERVLGKPGDSLAIAALDLAVPLEEIYAGVTFEA